MEIQESVESQFFNRGEDFLEPGKIDKPSKTSLSVRIRKEIKMPEGFFEVNYRIRGTY